jgi:hypothetical protein
MLFPVSVENLKAFSLNENTPAAPSKSALKKEAKKQRKAGEKQEPIIQQPLQVSMHDLCMKYFPR